MHKLLRADGYICSVRRVNRLMRECGLKAITTGLYEWRPGQHAFYAAQGNLIKNLPEPKKINQQWGGDFTYLKTKSGWLYFAVVMDLFNREVIGWSFSTKRNGELTKSALRMASNTREPKKGCYFHSDQGTEYMTTNYQESLDELGLVRSVSRRATPTDNAKVESFFHTMKSELGRPHYKDNIEAVAKIMEYVGFYNYDRIHSSLGYQTPKEYGKLGV